MVRVPDSWVRAGFAGLSGAQGRPGFPVRRIPVPADELYRNFVTVDLGNDGIAPQVTFSGPQIQSAFNSGFVTSLAVTLPKPATAGTCLVACIVPTSATVSGVTLGASADNWAQAVTVADAGAHNYYIWTDQNCAGGSSTVTVSLAGGPANVSVRVYEFAGVIATAAVDQTSSGTAAAGTAWSSGATGATVQASEIAVGMVGFLAASTPVLTGPATFSSNPDPWAGGAMLSGFQLLTATQAVTYSGTSTVTTTDYGALVITLKLSAAAAATYGRAQAVVGPSSGGDLWSLDQCFLSTSVGPFDASQCQVFAGPLPLPQYAVTGSIAGGSSQFGMGGVGVPFGWFAWALWTGGTPGATANLRLTGVKTVLTN